MIENMEYYICSSEWCIDRVQAGLNRSTAELYEILGRECATSIELIVRNRFFSANFYYQAKKVYIYLFDEVDPERITEYLLSTNKYSAEQEVIYELVCRIQQKEINKFYEELREFQKSGTIITHFFCMNEKKDYEKYKKKYQETVERRVLIPYKRIRQK